MPKLRAMVSELAGRAGIPTPRLFLIEAPYANAFATGRNPKHGVVAVTTGLLDLLEPREVRGVIAHELAHIKNRDILVATVAAAVATAVSYAAQAFTFQAFLGGGDSDEESAGDGAGGLLALLVAPLIATLVQLGISRSREYLADETGARIAGDAEGLASALARLERGSERMPMDEAPATASLFIVNPLAGARVAHLFSTHPPMEERIRRLRELQRDPAYAA
jgi:heat shock protein HtpX